MPTDMGAPVPLSWFLILSGVLFAIGMIGVLTRRNVLVIFMSVELMMNAVNITLVAFGTAMNSLAGQAFVVFVVTVAAAEAAVGLAIIMALVRHKPTVDAAEMEIMKE
ncbi:MAG TPA: NADH-quinone oxidoreductase subunit NuoK [Chloroflexia bacterium]